MTCDYSLLPFEIWCDLLEESGIETDDLRLLFDTVAVYADDSQSYPKYYMEDYGDGPSAASNRLDEQWGDGMNYFMGSGNGYGYQHPFINVDCGCGLGQPLSVS